MDELNRKRQCDIADHSDAEGSICLNFASHVVAQAADALGELSLQEVQVVAAEIGLSSSGESSRNSSCGYWRSQAGSRHPVLKINQFAEKQ